MRGGGPGCRDGLPLIERSAGGGWSRDPTPDVGYSGFSGVSCVSPKDCVAIGQGEPYGEGAPVALLWNGATWSSSRLQNPANDSILNTVSCVMRTFCMAAGTESFYGESGRRALRTDRLSRVGTARGGPCNTRRVVQNEKPIMT